MSISLLPFEPSHFGVLIDWFSTEKEVVQWDGTSLAMPITGAKLASMLEEAAGDPPTRICWMAAQEGELIGHAQIGLDWRNMTALLGRVAIAPNTRGRGLGRQMLRTVLDETFLRFPMERIELNVFTWNLAAIRCYEGLGFIREGVRRSSAIVGDERWDTAIMGLLRAEAVRGD